MSDKVYFICDDSCEPLDPYALSIESMDKDLYFETYGHYDWSFDSHNDAVQFMLDGFRDE